VTLLIRKKDLAKVPNLKNSFEEINQHLYAKLKQMDTDTRTRSKEIINLLLCKLVDEINKKPSEVMDFAVRNKESEKELLFRIQKYFEDNVKTRYKDIIEENEHIGLNKNLVYIVVQELQSISLLQSSKDLLRDAFEVFVSKALKEEGGQFFTPINIIKFMVNFLNPDLGSKIIDPACGHGGFLLELRDLLQNKSGINVNIKIVDNLYGMDKDSFLVKICKLYLEILSGEKAKIYCEDSLDPLSYRLESSKEIKDDYFDYVLTNPPFGARIPIDNKELLNKYQLGHLWRNFEGQWEIQPKLVKKQAPQILFIERCVNLLRNGGKMGIILPEGIFGNPSDRYIWEYLNQNGKILAVVSLDQNAFQPYTCNKTSILFFEKLKQIPNEYDINFAIINNVGHDKDGKVTYRLQQNGDPILNEEGKPIINNELRNLHFQLLNAEDFDYTQDQKIFRIKNQQIYRYIYIPSYYTGVEKTLKLLETDANYQLYTIKQLTEEKIIYTNQNGYIPRGDEIGSHLYGLGDVPFIRTSEINNWEINLESNKSTSEEVYEKYREKQNLEVGDILLVKDGGSNLIGNTAYISELDTKIIIQSHIFQLKVIKNDKLIDPYLLLYLLNLEIVQKQIQAITFVQGTIASIGNRIMDVILPFPSKLERRKEISSYVKAIIENKTETRRKIIKLKKSTLSEFNFNGRKH
jgi:type I restriction enzyme M protein